MKADFRYTPESVFDTYPWPQEPSRKDVDAVAKAGKEIRQIRKTAGNDGTGLRDLYRTLDLPGNNPLRHAHEVLDAAVLRAYGFSARGDLLSQILEANVAVASAIEHLGKAAGPGIPPNYQNPERLISDDSESVENQ